LAGVSGLIGGKPLATGAPASPGALGAASATATIWTTSVTVPVAGAANASATRSAVARAVENAGTAATAASPGDHDAVRQSITALAHVGGAASAAAISAAPRGAAAVPAAVESAGNRTFAADEDREFLSGRDRDRRLHAPAGGAHGFTAVTTRGAAAAGTKGANFNRRHSGRYFEPLLVPGVFERSRVLRR
jgi:hypothetical protein